MRLARAQTGDGAWRRSWAQVIKKGKIQRCLFAPPTVRSCQCAEDGKWQCPW